MLSAIVPTQSASRYLQQLCKHWSHKFEVSFTPEKGRIALPFGNLELVAEETLLRVEIALNEGADPERAKMVVSEHLDRFAFREAPLAFNWSA